MPDTLPEPVRAEIARYLAQGWEWRIIARVLSRTLGFSVSPAELRELYADTP